VSQQEDCPFCQIARGEMDTEFVHEEENLVAFEDLDPKAPVHVLVIPREHTTTITDVPSDTLNNGEEAGQEVEHLHIHIMGGRELSMP
jgi:histidine triad (HIT) family protein